MTGVVLVPFSVSATNATREKWVRIRRAGRRNFLMGAMASLALLVASLLPGVPKVGEGVGSRDYFVRRWRASLMVGALTGTFRAHQQPFLNTWECRVQGLGASVRGHCVADERALHWFPGPHPGPAREVVVELTDVRRAESIPRWFGRSVLVLETADGSELWLALERERRLD
jgi:hypothetical protein